MPHPDMERLPREARKVDPRYLPQLPTWLFQVVFNPMYRDASVLPQRTGSKGDPRVYGVKLSQEDFSTPLFPSIPSNEVYFCEGIIIALGKEMEQRHLESAVRRGVVCCVREG
ncbi:hypothetical protein GOP47_0015169 [Adiantum capillus-veneris]|nr:hypothetical protein GOP47_0015169 [Adiantum capillus-veneris]